MLFSSTKSRRLKLRSTPIPQEWREILHRRFPLLACLPPEDQRELEGHECETRNPKSEAGKRDTDCYPDLKSILVYPSTYFSRVTEEDEEQKTPLAAQSWQRGPVILAWDAVQGGVSDRSDGQNVVFHEFAHQLDEEDGRVDGVPVLNAKGPLPERLSRYRSWAKILSQEFAQLQQASAAGQKSVLEEYGATNPAEFFAVATECFFEKPRPMREKHPELYDELKRFYQQDPAEWRSQTMSTPQGSA